MKEKSGKKKRRSAEISFSTLLLKVEGWIKYLVSKWAIILIFSLLGAILGYCISRFKRPVFRAASTFVLEDSDKLRGMGQFAGLASIVGLDLSLSDAGGIFQGDNILELYKSNSIIEKTLLTQVNIDGKRELLIDRYIKFNKLREKWAKSKSLRNLEFTAATENEPDSREKRLKDSVLATVVKVIREDYLTIDKPDKRLNIIKVELRAPDESFAKCFDEQIVKNVNDFYIQTKTSKALYNVLLLQRKTDSIRAVMKGVKPEIESEGQPNLEIKGSDKGPIESLQQSEFSKQTNWAILSDLVKNLELSKITLQKQMPLIQLIDKPEFPLESDQISPIEGIVFGFLISGVLATLVFWLKKLYTELRNEVD